MGDQNFDEITQKFHHNIYGTSKGQLRHLLLCHHLSEFLTSSPLNILDAGGGTGKMTGHLAALGHKVTLLDVSRQSIDVAASEVESDNVVYQHGGIDEVSGIYDAIVCHAVLEWLSSPREAIQKLTEHLKPGGLLSLSFFNREAAIYGNLLYGNFDYVRANLKRKNTVRLNPNNPQSPQQVMQWLSELGLDIKQSAGIRCIHDYMKNGHAHVTFDELVEMECQYGVLEPYKWLGKYFHVIATKQ